MVLARAATLAGSRGQPVHPTSLCHHEDQGEIAHLPSPLVLLPSHFPYSLTWHLMLCCHDLGVVVTVPLGFCFENEHKQLDSGAWPGTRGSAAVCASCATCSPAREHLSLSSVTAQHLWLSAVSDRTKAGSTHPTASSWAGVWSRQGLELSQHKGLKKWRRSVYRGRGSGLMGRRCLA